MRGDKGQASLESVALTLLVAAIVTAAAVFAPVPALADSIVRQMQRGLCIVRLGDCERDRQPCVTSSVEDQYRSSVKIAFVKIDDERTLLLEKLSDGRVRVTFTHDFGAGLEASLGGGFELAHGKVAFGVGGELRAAAMAAMRSGNSAILPSEEAAEELRRWMREPFDIEDDLEGLEPEASFKDVRVKISLGATAEVEAVLRGDLELDSADALGVRHNKRNGHNTLYYRRGSGFDAALGTGPEGMRKLAGIGHSETTVYGIEVDEHLRPVDFSISSLEPVDRLADLPPEVRGEAARQAARGGGSQVVATERHLDLTRPENLEAVKGFLEHMNSDRVLFGIAAPVVDRLSDRLDAQATHSARIYSVETEGDGFGVNVNAGIGAGVDLTERTINTRLLAALERGPSGAWQASVSCSPGEAGAMRDRIHR